MYTAKNTADKPVIAPQVYTARTGFVCNTTRISGPVIRPYARANFSKALMTSIVKVEDPVVPINMKYCTHLSIAFYFPPSMSIPGAL